MSLFFSQCSVALDLNICHYVRVAGTKPIFILFGNVILIDIAVSDRCHHNYILFLKNINCMSLHYVKHILSIPNLFNYVLVMLSTAVDVIEAETWDHIVNFLFVVAVCSLPVKV